MRVARPIAWSLILLTLFTAGILRQFHDQTPRSPYVPPVVGSLLFAGIFFLLLVSAREWRLGSSPGKGIRIGSLTPLLLMLLMEKWISLTFYNPVFFALSPLETSDAVLDAQYRGFAGIGLLLIFLLLATFSLPASRTVRRRSRLSLCLPAFLCTTGAVVLCYAVLWALGKATGSGMVLAWPRFDSLLVWILVGQFVLAFAEEAYYRGLLLAEFQRLAPRLGLRRRAGRRWFALLATGMLFGMEHLAVTTDWEQMGRQLIFAASLGVLLGLLVLITGNLVFAAGIHAWINWMLLGAMPRFLGEGGRPVLDPGPYIGIVLILAFCMAALLSWRTRAGAAA